MHVGSLDATCVQNLRPVALVVFEIQGFNSCYMQKYLPFKMYCGSALLLFTRKLHYLQTFEHMSAHLAIKAWVFVKFYTHHRVR